MQGSVGRARCSGAEESKAKQSRAGASGCAADESVSRRPIILFHFVSQLMLTKHKVLCAKFLESHFDDVSSERGSPGKLCEQQGRHGRSGCAQACMLQMIAY